MSGFKPYDPNSGGGALGMPVAPSGDLFLANGNTWEQALSTSTSQVYKWSTDTSATDPASGGVKGNNSDLSLITELYISDSTLDGGSIKSIGEEADVGDTARIQQYGVGGNYFYVRLTAKPIDNGGWWTVSVVVTGFSGGFVDGVDMQFTYWATSSRVNNIAIERLYDGESGISPQEPTALDTPQYIQFGPVFGTALDPIQTITQGVDTEASILRINQGGMYRLKIAIQYGRETNTGVAILNFRALINGAQAGRTINQRLNNADVTAVFTEESWLFLPSGLDISYEVVRDSNGANSGGLIEGVVSGSTGWNSAPTASLRVERFISI